MRRFLTAGMVLALLAALVPAQASWAQTADEIQQQIDGHTAQIDILNKEIAEYQKQLDSVSSKKTTLQSTVNQLNLSIKKTTASINVTKAQISTTQLQIQQLAGGIQQKQASIESAKSGIGESVRTLNDVESQPLSVQVLAADNLSELWEDVDRSQSLQSSLQEQIQQLAQQKKSLTDTKTAAETKRAQLLKQQQTLQTQQGSLSATKQAQSELLTVTKAQEANFQYIIAQKKAQEAAFEDALSDLQTKLQYAVNPDQILAAGKGILHWPVDKVRITQNFGNTAFAAAGAYNGKGHNGIDLAASIGTPIKAALTGTVVGTGNTDAVRGCYSFGKWVMVKHGNGLSTMYAHLSQIQVTTGQSVATGQLLGYSGETGYATGPHLHFGVYVSSATQIVKLGSVTNKTTACSGATMPVAPLSGYLNPANYL